MKPLHQSSPITEFSLVGEAIANPYAGEKARTVRVTKSQIIDFVMKINLHPAAVLALALGAATGFSEGASVLHVPVLDQIGDVSLYNLDAGPGPGPSQVFTDFPEFSSTILEDFIVTSEQLQVTNVTALFRAQAGFSSFQLVAGYALNIFSNPSLAASGLSGDVASIFVTAGSGVAEVVDAGGNHEYGLVSLDVNVFLPAAGEYWFGVSPVSASTVSGQFYLQNSGASGGTSGNSDARLANPGDGFGLGVISTSNLNYAYSVTVVPEPSTATFSVLVGCGWLFRRTRTSPLKKVSVFS